MQEIFRGNAALIEALSDFCDAPGGVHHSNDAFGNAFHWFRLTSPHCLEEAARRLKAAGARLCMITAYNRRQLSDQIQEICYHFALDGVVYNVTVTLGSQHPDVPSITPIFANADWHEREMMELYAVRVTGHPNPRRLFLDDELDAGILNEAVPLSIVMNGACTTDLWECILKDKGGRA